MNKSCKQMKYIGPKKVKKRKKSTKKAEKKIFKKKKKNTCKKYSSKRYTVDNFLVTDFYLYVGTAKQCEICDSNKWVLQYMIVH